MTPIQQAAERLRNAAETREPCAPIRDLIAQTDIDSAYAIQNANTRLALARGRRLVGRKIGLTSLAVQKQLGVDQPDFGMLFDDMRMHEDRPIPMGVLMQPKIEAEIALVLERPLTRTQHTPGDIAAATAYAMPALEIVGSRIASWNIRIADTIADNASSSHFVLGRQRVSLADFDLVGCTMVLRKGGAEVSAGNGAACMGNPLNAAAWLADAMVKFGQPLQAGDIVLTGALGPMVAVGAGDVIEAEIAGLGAVRAVFS